MSPTSHPHIWCPTQCRRLLGLLGVKAGSCGVGQAEYVLPFQLGQNDFDVFINPNTSTAAQVHPSESRAFGIAQQPDLWHALLTQDMPSLMHSTSRAATWKF